MKSVIDKIRTPIFDRSIGIYYIEQLMIEKIMMPLTTIGTKRILSLGGIDERM